MVGLVGLCFRAGGMCMVMEYVGGGGLEGHVLDPFKLKELFVDMCGC